PAAGPRTVPTASGRPGGGGAGDPRALSRSVGSAHRYALVAAHRSSAAGPGLCGEVVRDLRGGGLRCSGGGLVGQRAPEHRGTVVGRWWFGARRRAVLPHAGAHRGRGIRADVVALVAEPPPLDRKR